MKVIKPGTKKEWSLRVTCTGKGNEESGCGAELEVTAGDIFRTSSGHYDGSTDHFFTVRCAQCECDTDLPERKIPSRVADVARKNGPPRRRGEADRGPRD